MPTGVPNAGTPHASASITASPKPSFADGTSTALAALIQYGTSSGGTPPSVSSGTSPAASTARSWRFSGRDGSWGNNRYGPVGVQSQPRAGLRARDRAEAMQVDAHRQHGDPPSLAGTGQVRS